MTLTYFNDINVYFHMKNHYKMLKQVKSVIDTSLPQSLLKSPLAMHGLQKRLKGNTNEQLRKIYNSPIYMPQRGGQVKKHSCLNSVVKSESALRTSLQSRPNTRRNLLTTRSRPKETLPTRSCSVGPFTKNEKMFKFRQKKRPSVSSTRSSSNAESQNFNLQLDLGNDNSKDTSETSQSTKRSSKSSNNNESPDKIPNATDNTFLKERSSKSSNNNESPDKFPNATDNTFLKERSSKSSNNNESPDKFPNATDNTFLKERSSKSSNNNESPDKFPNATDNTFLKESSEEHEYLLFLLRITEDIIVNDFYSNNDIRQVFRFHIEANKHRLNVKKMHLHIGNLCKELCIDCKEYRNEIINKHEDPPVTFTNSPTRSCYLNNEAFLNCHDCSTIRTSSLYRLTSLLDEAAEGRDSVGVPQIGDHNSSITPSLLRLLEKLSLGRVTECTEPIGSTSTMNSPNCVMSNALGTAESKICIKEKSSMDFDAFIKELNSKEDILDSQNPNSADKDVNLKQESIALESPSVEIYTTLSDDNPQENVLELLEIRSSKVLPPNFLNALRLDSSGNSKSEIGLSEKNPASNSENYDFEYEKSTSSDSTLRGDKAEKNDEEIKVKQDEAAHEKKAETVSNNPNTILDKMSDDKFKAAEENVDKHYDKVTIAEGNQCSLGDFPLSVVPVDVCQDNDDDDDTLSNALVTANSTPSILDASRESKVKVTSNVNQTDHEEDRTDTTNEILHNQTNFSDQSIETTTTSKDSFKSIETQRDKQPNAQDAFTTTSETPFNRVSLNLQELEIDSGKCSDSLENQESERQDSILKVILQGPLNDSDYVMIKGPVYVYKPLLDSDPKLVVFNDEINPKLRRNSADSQHSNRTFTISNGYFREKSDANQQVDHSLLQDSVDEAVQYDQGLHSLTDDSVENILELTRRAYSQFSDLKLLQSDYDLTPQKDSGDKYHHLLVDATTSVSGVNIPESLLLLTDDYLVKSGEICEDVKEKQVSNASVTVEGDHKNVNDIDSYLKFDSKLFDNSYVNRRKTKMTPSASMPKLIMRSDTSGDPSYETLDGTVRSEYKSGEMLLGYESDFYNFDIPSQDSSLRSEGETYKNADKMKSRFPWSSYFQ